MSRTAARARVSWRGDERDINDEDDAMGLWSRLFGGKGEQGGHEPSSMPWDGRPSILEHVRSHVAIDGPGMAEGGDTLPDEERIAQGSKIRWAAGAMDGVATHHMGTGEDEEAVRKAAELVVAYSRQPTASNKAAVYRHVVAGHVVSIIDPVTRSRRRCSAARSSIRSSRR